MSSYTMQARHFVMIAEAIRERYRASDSHPEVAAMAREFCGRLAGTNPNFSRQRFLDAALGEAAKPYVDFGSVSEGTLRLEDLLPAAAEALESYLRRNRVTGAVVTIWQLNTMRKDIAAARKAAKALERSPSGSKAHEAAHEAAQEWFDKLCNNLTDFAPPFSYFGAKEGDAAAFGFWPSIDAIDDAVHSGEVLRVDELSEVPHFTDARYVVQINDHGNMTLWSLATHDRLTEVWSIV